MKISVIRKKVKHLKDLLSEYSSVNCTVKFIEKKLKETGAGGMEMEAGTYLNNMKRRLTKIEEVFDHLLK